jgi:hypothetical protein
MWASAFATRMSSRSSRTSISWLPHADELAHDIDEALAELLAQAR